MKFKYTEKSAEISSCWTYRYSLTRRWAFGDGKLAVFCLLNPSIANEAMDDPTVRKCVAFAKHWGRNGIKIVNLFAYRATEPKNLAAAMWPIGVDNVAHLRAAARECEDAGTKFICGWGENVMRPQLAAQARIMIGDLREFKNLAVLKLTKNGNPGHPLYLPLSSPIQDYHAIQA